MIKTIFEPYCEDCPDFYATSDTIHFNTYDPKSEETCTIIQCTDRDQCARLVARLSKCDISNKVK